jgi:hypothetical protein
MAESRKILLIFLFQLFLGVSSENAFSQEGILNGYQYLSPLPFSLDHNPETVIIIRFGEEIDIYSLQNELFDITGDISGKHTGKFTVSHDRLSLTFTPDQKFSCNEKVFLHLWKGIKTQSGRLLPEFSFWFTIRQNSSSDLSPSLPDMINIPDRFPRKSVDTESVKGIPLSFLDFNFPEITLSDQPTQGNILTTLAGNSSDYLYIFDSKAVPKYVRLMPHPISNLKPAPPGKITYYDSFVKGFIEIDSALNTVDTLIMRNGYRTDAHEILLLNNRHALMFSYDPRIVDMSRVIPGGNPVATVTGLVIQELDENRNLLFQWRSWDYFSISDSYSDLLASVVDYVHGNSLDADTDSTLIISSRNMNEITKISRLTGQIIWRLGGKNNEFIFENDPRQFAGQHSAIKHANGTLTLFDNGVGMDPLYSRGIEYEIDEINKKVKLIHEYRHIPDVYANVSGNLQRMDNGNTFIFWGPAIDHSEQFISELDQTGNAIFEAKFGMNIYPNYRAYRSLWEPDLFTFSTDTIQLEGVIQNGTLYRTFQIINKSNKPINITSAYHKNLGFYAKNLPVAIEAMSEASITVAFPSFSPGKISDNIIFCQETDSAIVTRSLFVSVDNTPYTGIDDHLQTDFKAGPNPCKGEFNIEVTRPGKFFLKLIDLSGKTIWDAAGEGAEFYNIDLSSKPDGLYLLYLEEVNKGIINRIKIVKHK